MDIGIYIWHTAVANFHIGPVRKSVQYLSKTFKNDLPIFVFGFSFYLLFPILFYFRYVGTAVIIIRMFIDEDVLVVVVVLVLVLVEVVLVLVLVVLVEVVVVVLVVGSSSSRGGGGSGSC